MYATIHRRCITNVCALVADCFRADKLVEEFIDKKLEAEAAKVVVYAILCAYHDTFAAFG